MKKTIFLFGMFLFIVITSFPLSAKEFKRGDWMIGIGGGVERNEYSYVGWGPMYSAYLGHQDFNCLAKSLHVEYVVRNDFSLALQYSETRASKSVATVYGPPNDQGWSQDFSDTTHMTSNAIGLSGAYHLAFLRIRRFDPMLTAGIKAGWSSLVLPTRVIDFPPDMVDPGDWINNIERPEYHLRHFSSWLALGCRYWLFQRLAIGCHCRFNYLLSYRSTPNSFNWTSGINMNKEARTGIYFEVVAKL